MPQQNIEEIQAKMNQEIPYKEALFIATHLTYWKI